MPSGTATRFTTGHVGLNVRDLTRSRQFYHEAFGFRVMAESTEAGKRFAFLGQDDTIVLTLWEQSRETFPADRAGLHHLSFQVETVEQVRGAEARLRALGAKIHHGGIVAHREGAGSGGLFFEDPDGIRLEIFAATGVAAHAPNGAAPTCGFF